MHTLYKFSDVTDIEFTVLNNYLLSTKQSINHY